MSTPTMRPATSSTPAAYEVPGTQLPCYVFESSHELSRHVAQTIAGIIRERNAFGQKAVLGLPTGSTPLGVYRELIRMHREDGLDFAGVITFNLDEYYGIQPDQLQSYHRWMFENFFDHVNIPRKNVYIPDGTVPLDDIEERCRRYEDTIERVGGIDLQLLGIGRNGHIGFNEPFSRPHSRTRLVTLDPVTRNDAASDFFSEENVPNQALTMGIGTILEARKIVLIALGEHKAGIVRESVEGPLVDRVPASFLREHSDAAILLDQAAAGQLTGVVTPWVLRQVQWTDVMIKRAVLWLSAKTGKALLKLDDHDFREHHLHDLLHKHGPAQSVAHRVFRWMMETIEYHPGGREPQRIICFSPHPDDDVISMGGALIRLVEDRHEVHVAYMTSGNIAVFDHDAQRVADLVTEFNRLFQIDQDKSRELETQVHGALAHKKPGEADSEGVLRIKALIRWSEAKAGAMVCGCREEHLHFLDLPFYRTGTIAKNPMSTEDVRIIRELLEQVDPQQVYIAGDLSDPHGTHRVCAEAIFQALAEFEQAKGRRPEALLYRGAWQEWAPHEIELAVPLSPRDLELKKAAIFMHESQKDRALFPGTDQREFWQRAQDRNRNTADVYNQFGLPEYFAIEGFVRWNGEPI
ncbi:MAG TPA: glucosamine-6-phosphate deaminase [Pirellulales bacterium]